MHKVRGWLGNNHVPMMLMAYIVSLVVSVAFAAQTSAVGFHLSSPSFAAGATIPHQYSYNGYGCTGKNVSPQLQWSAAPSDTKSFALTVFDPDARSGQGWWHWVVFNIPASVSGLPKGSGAGSGDMMPGGAVQGRTDFQTVGYGGPCPPSGHPPHHYVFTVYALDVDSLEGLSPLTSGPYLLKTMRGHVIAKATLTGLFGR
jgi:Raf kinase inhibitor-like YbhB/YbcL family protein